MESSNSANSGSPQKTESKTVGIAGSIPNLGAAAKHLNFLISPISRAGWKFFKFKSVMPGTDVSLALGVLALLAIFLVPLPSFILDAGLSVSITSSVLILMVSLFIEKPTEFTSFPTLLLLTTMFRLALEVATTRLILGRGSEGSDAAGHVIAAFGNFMMGNNVVIGGIVFCIILIVNFMVITKGSGRIAEVSARFYLDAMPGKQMAIDSDLSSGSMNEATARKKRKELEEESAFFGSMDGAAKFVRNDAIAAIIITSINIIGGLAIGVIYFGMPVADAARTFTTLTIGDGLVSQIPALLISLAAGIVVTKGGTDESADVTLFRQLGSNPKPLALMAVISMAFALLPGLPAFPFIAISVISGAAAWTKRNQPVVDSDGDVTESIPLTPSSVPITELLKVEAIRIDMGIGLTSLATGDHSPLTEKIKALRRQIASEMGLIIPSVRLLTDIKLDADRYEIKLKEITVGAWSMRPGKFMAILPMGAQNIDGVPGEETTEPAFGLPALWIDQADKEKAIAKRCSIIDPASVLITHLTEVLNNNLKDLLTYSETQALLDNLPRSEQKLANDLIPSQINLIVLQRVLQSLLQDGISIRDLSTILEGIQESLSMNKSGVVEMTSYVRVKLSRQICDGYAKLSGFLPIITFSSGWESILAEQSKISGNGDERVLALKPETMDKLYKSLVRSINKASEDGNTPVILTSDINRLTVRMIMERLRANKSMIPVISQSELYLPTPRQIVATVA
ncbi:flagellar biosynthesis protein FlhA [Acetobacter persici]|nr:flagellar biosynthesis protein FlhA [Acetobacter persici]